MRKTDRVCRRARDFVGNCGNAASIDVRCSSGSSSGNGGCERGLKKCTSLHITLDSERQTRKQPAWSRDPLYSDALSPRRLSKVPLDYSSRASLRKRKLTGIIPLAASLPNGEWEDLNLFGERVSGWEITVTFDERAADHEY